MEDEKTWTRLLTFTSAEEAIAYFNEETITSRYHKAGRDVTNPRTGRLLSSNCKKGSCRCEHRVRIPKIVTASQPVYVETANQCNHTIADDDDDDDEDDDGEGRIHDRKPKALPVKSKTPVAALLSLTTTPAPTQDNNSSTPGKSQQSLLQDTTSAFTAEVPLSFIPEIQVSTTAAAVEVVRGASAIAAESHDVKDKHNLNRRRKTTRPGSGLESDDLMSEEEDEDEEAEVMDETPLLDVIKPLSFAPDVPMVTVEVMNETSTLAAESHDVKGKHNLNRRRKGAGLGSGSGLASELGSDDFMNEEENEDEEAEVMDDTPLLDVIKPADVDTTAPAVISDLANNGTAIMSNNRYTDSTLIVILITSNTVKSITTLYHSFTLTQCTSSPSRHLLHPLFFSRMTVTIDNDDEKEDGDRSMVSYDDDFDDSPGPVVKNNGDTGGGDAGVSSDVDDDAVARSGGAGGNGGDIDDGPVVKRSTVGVGVAEDSIVSGEDAIINGANGDDASGWGANALGGNAASDNDNDDAGGGNAGVSSDANDGDGSIDDDVNPAAVITSSDNITPHPQPPTQQPSPLIIPTTSAIDLSIDVQSPATTPRATISPAPSVISLNLSPLPSLLPWNESDKTIALDSEKTTEKPLISKPPHSRRSSQKSSQKFGLTVPQNGLSSGYSSGVLSPLTTAKSATLSVAWDDLLDSDDDG